MGNLIYFMEKRILRVVLEGCPHSGKSAVSGFLKNLSAMIPVALVDEAATDILQVKPNFLAEDPIAFQKNVLMMQYQREEDAFRFCQKRMEEEGFSLGMVIVDRGAADAYVYLDDQTAAEICHMTLDELLSRYDYVFHFDPYLGGTSLQDGNDVRAEKNTDEIFERHRNSLAVWSQHSHFETVPVFETKEEKVRYVISRLHAIAGEEVFEIPVLVS